MLRGYLLVLLYLSTVACAQADPIEPPAKAVRVTIGFLAFDPDKHLYTDLKQDDLTVLDNRRPVKSMITLRKSSELPLRLGLLIDASASQRNSELYKPGVLAAWNSLNDILKGPDDKVFVVKVTATPEVSNFMNASELKNYELNVTPVGGTALYDGIGLACDSRMKGDGWEASRQVLIVLSDGDDNLSHIGREAAIEKAVKAGVVIFSVSTEDQWSAYAYGEKGNNTLQHFAEETGGGAFLNLDRKKIEQSFSAIAEAINNMYFVTFEPADASKKGLHRIELKSLDKDRLRFRAPKGYFVP